MFNFRKCVIRKSDKLSIVPEDSPKNLPKKVLYELFTVIYTKKSNPFLKKYSQKHDTDKLRKEIENLVVTGDNFVFMSSR